MTHGQLKYLYALIAFAQYIVPLRDLIVRIKNAKGHSLKWYKRITLLGYILLATGTATAYVTYKTAEEDKKPLLNVYEGPRFTNRVADSIPIALSIKNFGKSNARNINSKIVSVRHVYLFFIKASSVDS